MIHFNKNLIYLREKNNLTQKELADRLGVKIKTYQAWEERRGFPKPILLLKVCELFEVRDLISLLKEELYKVN
jgi:transcriptional regulator with XRE-family HTH domain